MNDVIDAPDRLITARQYCEILGISKSTLIRRIGTGEVQGPVEQDGNFARYSYNYAQGYIRKKKQEAAGRIAQSQQQVAA